MTEFILRRAGFAVIVMVFVTLITFTLLNLAPGDPAQMLAGPQADAETIEQVRQDMGLDQPFLHRYLSYLQNLGRLDLGVSLATGRPVLSEIADRAPATFELMLLATLMSLSVGIPLGVLAAMQRGKAPEVIARVASIIGASTPAFWLGLLLILLFYRTLDWFPAYGRFTGTPPEQVTGFLTIDSILAGDFMSLRIALAHLTLPALSLALLELGVFARLVKNQMLEVLESDYVRVARAGGLSESQVLQYHALRNGLAPLVTIIAAGLATMLYGSVSLETVFGWPGAGRYVVDAIFRLDFPIIMGFAVLTSAAYLVANFVADLIYAMLDPRIRLT